VDLPPSLFTVVALLVLTVRFRELIPSGRTISTGCFSFDPFRLLRVLLAVSLGEGLTGSMRNLVVLVAVSMCGGATGTQEESDRTGCCIHEALSSISGRERVRDPDLFDLTPIDVNIAFALSKSTELRRLSCTTIHSLLVTTQLSNYGKKRYVMIRMKSSRGAE